MELSLVKIVNKKTGKIVYQAVNDKHYDAMLASGGSSLDDEYEWDWLGEIDIPEEILNEQQYFYVDLPKSTPGILNNVFISKEALQLIREWDGERFEQGTGI